MCNKMKKMKKLVLFAIILSVVFVVGACSKKDDALKIWSMSEPMKEFAEQYAEENDINVDVQVIPWGNVHDKLLTAVASGEGPDVLQIGNTFVTEFAEAGTFLDLTEYMDDYPNFSSDNFFDSA